LAARKGKVYLDNVGIKMAFATSEGTLLEPNQARFDFSIEFERLFFSILPSVIFIVAAIWRTLVRAKRPVIVHAPIFQLLKIVQPGRLLRIPLFAC
jgi:hypothetical protein